MRFRSCRSAPDAATRPAQPARVSRRPLLPLLAGQKCERSGSLALRHLDAAEVAPGKPDRMIAVHRKAIARSARGAVIIAAVMTATGCEKSRSESGGDGAQVTARPLDQDRTTRSRRFHCPGERDLYVRIAPDGGSILISGFRNRRSLSLHASSPWRQFEGRGVGATLRGDRLHMDGAGVNELLCKEVRPV